MKGKKLINLFQKSKIWTVKSNPRLRRRDNRQTDVSRKRGDSRSHGRNFIRPSDQSSAVTPQKY